MHVLSVADLVTSFASRLAVLSAKMAEMWRAPSNKSSIGTISGGF